MFNHVEEKLKGYAALNFVVVIIFAVIGLIPLFSLDEMVVLLLPLYAIIIYTLLAVCWFMYAFAEITESVKETNKALQLAFERNIAEAEERHREEAEARDEEAKAEAEKTAAEAEAAEAARKKRFDDYWETHAEEKAALLAKKREMEEALKSAKGIARQERKRLQDLIRSIDEELSKER